MTKQEFIDEATKLLNIVKPNRVSTDSAINNILSMTNNNEKLMSLIILKYKQYLDKWEYDFGKHDPIYMKKEQLRKPLNDFVFSDDYKNDFSIKLNERDRYFFGDANPFKLDKALLVFYEKYNMTP